MKKVLIVLFLVFTIEGFAQQNAVKVGLLGLNYGDFGVSYERLINTKSSFNFTIGYLNPKISWFDFPSYFEPNEGVWLTELNSGFHTSLDYRFYVGNHQAIKGFYLGPYLRYWGLGFDMKDIIDGDSFDVNSKISSIGLGFQMGYHWVINNKFSLDWYFVGLGVEKLNMKGAYVNANSGFNYASIQDDVEDVFSGMKIIQNQLETVVTPDALDVKLPLWFPGIKTGFTIGYAF